ncbi:MAG: Drug resistance transporter, EmrB/QacA subfamily [Acidimicrobiales bacterium]|nr:Drug resistance transporter, EmrB/QacA subfamily [Acidimicrobiales bacterium]
MRAALRDPDVVYRRRWLTLLVLCFSLVVIVLDNTILNVALPRLSEPTSAGGLGATFSQLQWIVDSYTIVFAGLLLTAGSLGDRFGRYRSLAFGLAVFGVGSALSAVSGSASTLIATRALMGIGGAFIMPATLSILTNVFTEPKERSKAIGVWAGVSALGLGIGPITGGFLLTHFWWGSIFLVNVPFVVGGLVLGYFLIPESRDPSAPRLDPGGALLSIAGLGTLLWAVIEAPGKGWTAPEILAGFAVGIGLLAAFMVWELKSSHPMLDLRFFKNPRFSAASGAITITFLALFGVIFLLTQYLQLVLGYSTIKAGAVLLPQALVIMVTAPLSSAWVHRFGNKVVVATGMFVVALSMVSFATLTTHSSVTYVILLTMLLGAGMGNIMAPATDSIMGSLPRAKAGVGSAVNDTTRQVGGAVGVAVLGSVLASQFSTHMTTRLRGVVPAGQLHGLTGSIGPALAAAQHAPVAVGAKIVAAANESFVSGLHVTSWVAAAMLFAATIGVARWLPARAGEEPNHAGFDAVVADPAERDTALDGHVAAGAALVADRATQPAAPDLVVDGSSLRRNGAADNPARPADARDPAR